MNWTLPGLTPADKAALPPPFLTLHRHAGGTLGAIVAAAVDVGAVQASLPLDSVFARLLHAFWDVTLLLVLGLLIDGVILVSARAAGKRYGLGPLLLAAANCGGMSWLMGAFLLHRAHHTFDGRYVAVVWCGFVLATGLGLTACTLIGQYLGRLRRAYVVGPALALTGLVLNQLIYRDDYTETHVCMVWATALLLGTTLATRFNIMLPGANSRWPNPRLVVLLLAALLAVFLPPPNYVRLALLRSPGAAGAWVFATTSWSLPAFDAAPDPHLQHRWLAARSHTKVRPPSSLRLFDAPPVVVLLTVDAVRADILFTPAAATQLPTLTRLAREGVSFTQARTPGSQTAISLTALFSGKYFSELKWAPFGVGDFRYVYAAVDATPRVPALLAAGGVATSKVASIAFLANAFGVASGFAEEFVVASDKSHAPADRVIEPLLRRLGSAGADRPLFLYAHLTEPHAPYDRGTLKTGSNHARYLSEITLADTFVGQVVDALSTPELADRSLLIVTSDHGEAFGEHGTTEHSKTVYDELLRVPLLVWGKPVRPRAVVQPVSLIDLGPTLLDAFGLGTPGDFAGESLVPLLQGHDPPLTRPMLAEGRLRRALILNQLKVIVDQRLKTIEAYDLALDPGELNNLYDQEPARFAGLLSALQAYMDAHTYREAGYEHPYRR